MAEGFEFARAFVRFQVDRKDFDRQLGQIERDVQRSAQRVEQAGRLKAGDLARQAGILGPAAPRLVDRDPGTGRYVRKPSVFTGPGINVAEMALRAAPSAAAAELAGRLHADLATNAAGAERAVGRLTERMAMSRREMQHMARVLAVTIAPGLGGAASQAVFLATSLARFVPGVAVVVGAGIAIGTMARRILDAQEAQIKLNAAVKAGDPSEFLPGIEKAIEAQERWAIQTRAVSKGHSLLDAALKHGGEISVSYWARALGPSMKVVQAEAEKNRKLFELTNKELERREGLQVQLELAGVQRKIADETQRRVVGVEAVTTATGAQVKALRDELAVKKEILQSEIDAKAKPLEEKGLAGAAQGVRARGAERVKALEAVAGLEIEALRRAGTQKNTETGRLEAEDLAQQEEMAGMREAASRQHQIRLLDLEEGWTGDILGIQRRRVQMEEEAVEAEVGALRRSTKARLAALDVRAERASNEELRQIFYERARLQTEAANREEQIAREAQQRRVQRELQERQQRAQRAQQGHAFGQGALGAAAARLEARGHTSFTMADMQAELQQAEAEGRATKSQLRAGGAATGEELRTMFDAAGRAETLTRLKGSFRSTTQAAIGGLFERPPDLANAYRSSFDAVLTEADTFFEKLGRKFDEGNEKIAKRTFNYFTNGVARTIELEERRF